jgi:hypothetical protein
MFEQLELPLFPPPSFDELIVTKRLKGLTLSFSERLTRSWRMSVQPVTRDRHLVVPACLAVAPTGVKEALLEWAMLPSVRRSSRRNAQIRERKAALEALVWSYVEAQMPRHCLPRAIDPRRLERRTCGTRYDLREVFDSVNAAFFENRIRASVRWGTYASLTSHASRRRSPEGVTFDLITIAGVYDHPSVPRFAIEGVMYHEMLHIAIPPVTGNGRRVVHGSAFREAERQYPCYGEWEVWQQKSARRLARAMRRTRQTARI